MNFLIGVINIFLITSIVFFLYKSVNKASIKPYFLPALFWKLLAGLILGLVYRYYYDSGDTFLFFEDASALADMAYKSPANYIKILFGNSLESLHYSDQPRALFFVKILSLPAIITLKNYWLSGLYFSLFSFWGMWKLTDSFSTVFPKSLKLAVFAFLFYPSVVFWSSGVLKESIIMGCLSLCLVVYLPYIIDQKAVRRRNIIISIFLLLIIWQLKFYYATVLIPLLLVSIAVTYLKAKWLYIQNRYFLQFIVSLFLLIIFYFPVSFLHPLLNAENILREIIRNHDWYLIDGILPIDGYIHYSELKPELGSFVRNFPLAFFSGLFRPLISDGNNLFQFLVGIENTLLFFLCSGALFRIAELKISKYFYIVMMLILYIAILATILAFAAPNFGSLMRYKIAFLPFLVFLVTVNNSLVEYIIKRQRWRL